MATTTISYWVAVNGEDYGSYEMMFHKKPMRAPSGADMWIDWKTNSELQSNSKEYVGDNDYSMILPKGTIEKIIDKKLTWADDPVEITIDMDNY